MEDNEGINVLVRRGRRGEDVEGPRGTNRRVDGKLLPPIRGSNGEPELRGSLQFSGY